MKTRPLELCFKCGCATEKAGRSDDSLYNPIDDTGPYCDECWDTREVTCPFCHDSGFDPVGLKLHLERGACNEYNELEISGNYIGRNN